MMSAAEGTTRLLVAAEPTATTRRQMEADRDVRNLARCALKQFHLSDHTFEIQR